MTFEEWWVSYRGPVPEDETTREKVERVSSRANAERAWNAALEHALPVAEEVRVAYVKCGGSGYEVHPDNGRNRDAKRCRYGCAVVCSVCNDPNCENPGGQH